MEKKNFSAPDTTTAPPKAIIQSVTIRRSTVKQIIHTPGWKWSTDMGPVAGSDLCQNHHLLYVFSGQLQVTLRDGSRLTLNPGDIADIPPDHDAWVEGEDRFVALDMAGVNSR